MLASRPDPGLPRVLATVPEPAEPLATLDAFDVAHGPLAPDPSAVGLLCTPLDTVDAAALEALPRLRAIAVAGAGLDGVDSRAAEARGIAVVSAGEALVAATADLAFALILTASRGLWPASVQLRAGEWTGWRFDDVRGREVSGSTLGLVGFGRIGRAVAARAAAFDMEVLHHTRTPTGEPGWTAELSDLIDRSDVVSLHAPLTDATRNLLSAEVLARFRGDQVLVNTARGALVDEDALAARLEAGGLLAAGLDVFSDEPRVPPRLLAAPRTVLLPHLGSATARTRSRMLALAAERLAAALA